jgi:hypothetical protein
MTKEIEAIPKWIRIVSALFALLGAIVTATLIFSPHSALETVDLNAKGVGYLIYMWAARQFALGFIFGYATWKQSRAMLTLAYIFFLVMNVGDFFIGIHQNDKGLISGAMVVSVISIIMLYFINRKSK